MIRLLLAAGFAFIFSIIGTKILINWLTGHGVGQPIREDGPKGHLVKAGTPTMGGLAIIGSAFLSYMISDAYRGIYTRTGIFTILTIMGAGFVGFIDDWIKVKKERNLGLNKRAKSIGLFLVAASFPAAMLLFTAQHTTISITRYSFPGWDIGKIGWWLFALFLILATTNAVNLTDGLDGLAGGSAIFGFATLTMIGFWAFRYPDIYDMPHALDSAVVAIAMLGSCAGFLWWNAAPARIFMGDTGSLAIGAALSTLALSTNTQLLLIFIGGLYLVETISVILQISVFKLFDGKRLFRMAPIHHHFELLGWPETTVIIRFWICTGLSTAVALAIYYADFVRIEGLG